MMLPQQQQWSLFDTASSATVDPKQKVVEWSLSKRQALEQCSRRYYYHHYGSSSRSAVNEPEKTQLRFSRRLSNSWMLAGIILHIKIREALQTLKAGSTMNPEEIIRAISERWQRTKEASVHFARKPDVDIGSRKVLLMEFVFGHPDAEGIWSAAGERLRRALVGFLTVQDLERFRRGGVTEGAAVEQKLRIEGPGFCMRGQIDLAWRENGRVTVADWKSGSRDGADSDLQLLAYSLAVQKYFNCSLNELDLFRVELDDGRTIRQEVNEREAARAKARIAQDTRLMMDLDGYGREGVVEAFTPTGSKRVCRLCPYQRICPGSEA